VCPLPLPAVNAFQPKHPAGEPWPEFLKIS